jgi:hypothetical protein
MKTYTGRALQKENRRPFFIEREKRIPPTHAG